MLHEDAEETRKINTENGYRSEDEDSALTIEKSDTNRIQRISNSSQNDIANTSRSIMPNITTHCAGKRRKPNDPVFEQVIIYSNSKKSPSEHQQEKTDEDLVVFSIISTQETRTSGKQKAPAKISIQLIIYEIEYGNQLQ